MSFNIKNLTPVANNAKAGIVPVLWMYYNKDNDTITTADYFKEEMRLQDKDQILCVSQDGTSSKFYHIVKNGNSVSAVANS